MQSSINYPFLHVAHVELWSDYFVFNLTWNAFQSSERAQLRMRKVVNRTKENNGILET